MEGDQELVDAPVTPTIQEMSNKAEKASAHHEDLEVINPSRKPKFKIMSWNINGIKTLDMPQILEQLNCSILCVQETKLARKQLEQNQMMPPGYTSYFSFSTNRIGYSGVATYSRNDCTPEKAEDGLSRIQYVKNDDEVGGYPELTAEEQSHVKYANADGRTVITQHLVKMPDGTTRPLALINVYCPRLRDDPEDAINNTEFKKTFHEVLHRRAKLLVQSGSFVVLVGDINIRHRWIDQCDVTEPKNFVSNEFRGLLSDFLSDQDPEGFVDSFRMLYPDKQSAFTCWCTMLNARENNYGSRIDYIFVDRELAKYIEEAEIHSDVLGSDHCPISVTFHTLVPVPHSTPPSFATKYYPEFSGKQMKLKEFFQAASLQKDPDTETKFEGKNAVGKKRPLELDSMKKGQNTKRLQTSLRSFFVKSSNLESETVVTSSTSNKDNAGCDQEKICVTKLEKPSSNSSEAWKKLLKPPEVPLCQGHKEPCVKRTAKKKGINFGRQFWCCSHGIGNNNDPNANCNFFQWVNPTTSKYEK